MWNRYALCLSLVAVVLLAGCTKNYRLNRFPKGEIALDGSLEFEFQDSIAPRDSVGIWSSTPYLQFDPPIAGSFKWLRRDLLAFIPQVNALPPSKEIVAKANPALFFGKKAQLSPGEIKFHTPYLQATRITTSWAEYDYLETESPADVHLEFPYPVDPSALRENLEIMCNGRKVESISMNNYSPSIELSFSVDLGAVNGSRSEIEVHIKPGLGTPAGDAKTTSEQVLRDTLEAVAILDINRLDYEFEEGVLRVIMEGNQGMNPKSVAPYISLEPEQPFELEGENGNVVIMSDFKPGTTYSVHLRKGMPGKHGGSLPEDASRTITMPPLRPFIKFADAKGHFLMRNGFENLNVKAANVDSFTVRLYEIYENNLLHFLEVNPGNFRRYHYYDYDTEDEYYYGDDYSYLSIENFGAEIHEEVVKVPAGAKSGVVDVPVKLQKQYRNKFKGIFVVEIENHAEDRWMSDYKVVSLSDLGIIAKWNDDELVAWVTRLSTGMPAPGTTVSIISHTNQAYMTATTDAMGMARFKDVGPQWSDNTFRPELITASNGNDFQFLHFYRTEVDQDRYDIEGKSKSTYDVFCYGDRNLYRPGDTMHFSAIVRNWDYSTPKGLPVTAEIKSPDGATLEELQLNASDKGAIELTYPIPENARTGGYYIDLSAGSTTISYEAYQFQVEDFVPDKIKVLLTAMDPSGRPGDTLRFPLQAAYYFGTPCDAHDYRVTYTLRQSNYRSSRFPQYDFSSEGDVGEYQWGEHESQLDADGRDTAYYIVPTDISGTGIYSGVANATVWDNTGHTVQSSKRFAVASRAHFIGFKTRGNYFNINEPYNLDFVAVNFADQVPKDVKMEVKLVRFDWKRAMRRESNGFFYVSESESVVLKRDTITQNGDVNHFAMRLAEAGNYELTVTLLDGSGSKRTQFSAYGRNATTATSFGVNREGTVAITFDKAQYKAGENARILLTTPFSGRMLVTLERDKIYESRYVDVVNNAAEITVPIREAHTPNIWVSATLFRPLKTNSNIPMMVAHGYASVPVEAAARRMPVRISAPEQIKPGRTQAITVQARPGAHVTVSVVDEGILAIKHYRTPDPYANFYAPRNLEVRSYDFFKFLLPEVPSGVLATGGSDAGDWSSFAHQNPIRTKRFKPFSYWSGIRKADGSGRVTVQVPFPEDFAGRARIMVAAYDGAAFGSGEQPIIVKNDLIVMAAIPRFLTAGDSLQMPVNLMNLTDKPGMVTVNMSLTGPLSATTASQQQIEVPAQGTAVVNFALQAAKAGVGGIVLDVVGIAPQRQTVPIAVRPASPIVTEGGAGMITEGKPVAIRFPSDFVPELQQGMITVSPIPALEFAPQLDYLLHYPYGCLEQTVSAAFPQLYFGDLAEVVAPDKYNAKKAIHHVREAIKKLESMQLYSGGFSYWQGGDGWENKWGSIYATHFLVEARKAGYPVQQGVVDRALEHVLELAKDSDKYDYFYVWKGQFSQEKRAKKETIYALYVASLAGRADLPTMNYYKSHVEELTQDSKYLLAAAYALQKDRNSFEGLLPTNIGIESPVRETGGSFDSPMRAVGITLSALATADPGNARIPGLVAYLRDHRDEFLSTQDNAWIFVGLGKIVHNATQAGLTVDVQGPGASLGRYVGKNLSVYAEDFAGKEIALVPSGKGTGYYAWRLRGTRKGQGYRVPTVEEGMSVRREWYSVDGKPIHSPVFQVGELVVCRVRLQTTRDVENFVVTDMIPAGFEVENTRLSKGDYSWITQLEWTPQNLDIRDDRINYFGSASGNSKIELNYLVRAVNMGKYVQPAITAEAMYDPKIRAQRSGTLIRVVAKEAPMPGRSAYATSSSKHDSVHDAAASASTASCERNTIWKRFMNSIQP